METSLALVDALKQLGMTDMFSCGADFSKISHSGSLYVSDIAHKAFLEVRTSISQY